MFFCFFVYPDNRCAMKHRSHCTPSSPMPVNELSRYFKVSHSTICKLRRKGDLPFLNTGDGDRFDRHEIDRWTAEQQTNNRSRTSFYRS